MKSNLQSYLPLLWNLAQAVLGQVSQSWYQGAETESWFFFFFFPHSVFFWSAFFFYSFYYLGKIWGYHLRCGYFPQKLKTQSCRISTGTQAGDWQISWPHQLTNELKQSGVRQGLGWVSLRWEGGTESERSGWGEVLGEADSVEERAGGQAESARKTGMRLSE